MVGEDTTYGVDDGSAIDPADDEDFVVAATRSFLLEVAPDEDAVFDADPWVHVAGPRPTTGRDKQLEFGAELVMLLAPFVARAVVSAAKFVFDAMAEAAMNETNASIASWVKRLFRGEPVDKSHVPADLPRQVRELVLQTCRDLGLPEPDSVLVSDVVASRIVAAG